MAQTFLDEFDESGDESTMNREDYAEWIEQFDFTFAKESASRGAPHEYIILWEDLPSDRSENEMWFKFVVFIRANGYDMEFMNKEYRVCEIDGYLYWTLGSSLGETTFINRKPIDGYDGYVETDSPQPGVNDV